MKRSLSFAVILFTAVALCCGAASYAGDDDVMEGSRGLSLRQLLDTAEQYYARGQVDTALIYYHLITGTPEKDVEAEELKYIVDAHNKAAVTYYYMGDYRSAYESLINALSLAEQSGHMEYAPLIYTNIGNIYYRFNEYDNAKSYYLRALDSPADAALTVALYNNLGELETESGKADSALYYLGEALRISESNGDIYKYNILNSLAALHRRERRYDSTLYYYRSALEEARRRNIPEGEAEDLSDMGSFWLERNRLDSARYYIEASNAIALENNYLPTLTDNYHILSEIERARGNTAMVLEYFETYAALRDSMLNTKNFGDINQLQRLYEVSKINRQIEQLTLERQLREQTIYYHRIIQAITLPMLLVVSVVLLIVFMQKRRLNAAYKTLFEKNLEIINFHGPRAKQSERHKKPATQQEQDMQDDLQGRILAIMEETDIICDPKFSINVLAGLVQANHQYVSQVINSTFGKNFRTFLNGYRVREAQRLFADPNSAKYTIESVSLRVGFRSRSTFREAFKEVTGISPTFYLNSMSENRQPQPEPVTE